MPRLAAITLLVLVAGLSQAVEVQKKGEAMPHPELNADSLLTEADEIFQSRDYPAALELYKTLVDSARTDFNRSVEVEALAQVARVLLIQGDKEQGRQWLQKAGERATESDPMGWSRYLGVRGRYEWKEENLTAARKTFDDMYVYCNTNGLWSRAVDAAHMIAIVAETTEEQVEWSRRGIEAAESAGEESWLGPLWNNLAVTFYERQMYDSALECFTKAREYHWRHSGEIEKLFADYHVGTTYRRLGKLDLAGEWLRPVIAWAERIKNHSAMGQAWEDLGEIEIAQGRTSQGIHMLRKARDEYKIEGFDQSWPEIWDNINKRIAELERK
jgi:tetratricopeptide (TPR) repeat protein